MHARVRDHSVLKVSQLYCIYFSQASVLDNIGKIFTHG